MALCRHRKTKKISEIEEEGTVEYEVCIACNEPVRKLQIIPAGKEGESSLVTRERTITPSDRARLVPSEDPPPPTHAPDILDSKKLASLTAKARSTKESQILQQLTQEVMEACAAQAEQGESEARVLIESSRASGAALTALAKDIRQRGCKVTKQLAAKEKGTWVVVKW